MILSTVTAFVASCVLWIAVVAFALPEPSSAPLAITGFAAFDGPIEIGRATNVIGVGTNGNDLVGPIAEFGGDNADGFVVNGRDALYRATGGSIENLRILRKNGTNGGRAVVLTALDAAQRSGELTLRKLKIFPAGSLGGGGSGRFRDGLVIDGSMLTTPGAAGIRRVMIDDVRVAGATGRSIFLNNAVHCCLSNVQVDPGGVPLAIVEIRDGQNIEGVNMIVHGDLILSGSPVEVALHGRFHTLRIGGGSRAVTIFGTAHFLYVDEGATGLFCGHVSQVVDNKSNSFKVVR